MSKKGLNIGGDITLQQEIWVKITNYFKKLIKGEKKVKSEYNMLNEEIEEEMNGLYNNEDDVIPLIRKQQILNDYKDKLNQFLNAKTRVLKVIEIQKKIIDGKDILPGEMLLRNRVLNML